MELKIYHALIFVSAAVVFIFFGGCAVEEVIYLGDAKIKAPITPPPTHLNIAKEVGQITMTAKYSSGVNETKIKGATEDRYKKYYRISENSFYIPKNDNIEWELMPRTFTADIDCKVGENVSLFGGFNFSSTNEIELDGGYVGIGFHTHLNNPEIRFDVGLNFQAYDYLATSIVEGKTISFFGSKSSTYSYIFKDKGKSTNMDPFITLTVNSSDNSQMINTFGTLGFFTQSLLNYNPGETDYVEIPFFYSQSTTDARSSCTVVFLYLNPGLSIKIIDEIRIVFSAKIIKTLNIFADKLFVVPSIQFDFQP